MGHVVRSKDWSTTPLLIDDLLDLSAIATGKLTLALSSVELGPLATTTVEMFQQEAEAGGVRLHADVADEGLRVEGDAARLSQVVGNLGLGLAIVRYIVELHHGSVRAESPGPGRGAVFTVELPLAGGAQV